MNQPNTRVSVDRYWFLTWTTYGTWLPGDQRGYVGEASDESGAIVNHNVFGQPPARPSTQLRNASARILKSSPVFLNYDQSVAILGQFSETAEFRNWRLIAVAIMSTHLHVIVGVPGDPPPDKILGDFKSYASRCLNKKYGRPASETWWTTGGSARKLPGDKAVENAVNYVRTQSSPHLIWTVEQA